MPLSLRRQLPKCYSDRRRRGIGSNRLVSWDAPSVRLTATMVPHPRRRPPWIVRAWTSDSSASASNKAIGFLAKRSAMTTLQGDDSKKVSAFRLGHPLVVDGGLPKLYQSTDGCSMGFRGSA